MKSAKYLASLLSSMVLFGSLGSIAAKSSSNRIEFNLAEACPVLPEAAAGENFGYTLSYQQKSFLASRSANIWYKPGKQLSERQTVIFYWHGTDGAAEEVHDAFGKNGVRELVDLGYVVVSPDHIRLPNGNGVLKYSWYIANGSRLNYDVVFGDLIVQCLNARFKTNLQVIASGCSAGAMQAALWSFQNADIVGLVLYSGGIFQLPKFVPRQKFWSVITHGGATDKRGDFNFMSTAIHIHKAVLKLGHTSALCDFTPHGHDIHAEIADIFKSIIVDAENATLPKQCSRERRNGA